MYIMHILIFLLLFVVTLIIGGLCYALDSEDGED